MFCLGRLYFFLFEILKDSGTYIKVGKDFSMKKSVFDSVEDTDSDYCLALLGMMYTQQREEKVEKEFEGFLGKVQSLSLGA